MALTLIGNDRLGSMIVPKGYKVTLYEHDHFGGYAETFDFSVLNLPERLAGQVSSIIITRDNGNGWVGGTGVAQPGWNNRNVVIFSECYYSGASNQMLPAAFILIFLPVSFFLFLLAGVFANRSAHANEMFSKNPSESWYP